MPYIRALSHVHMTYEDYLHAAESVIHAGGDSETTDEDKLLRAFRIELEEFSPEELGVISPSRFCLAGYRCFLGMENRITNEAEVICYLAGQFQLAVYVEEIRSVLRRTTQSTVNREELMIYNAFNVGLGRLMNTNEAEYRALINSDQQLLLMGYRIVWALNERRFEIEFL